MGNAFHRQRLDVFCRRCANPFENEVSGSENNRYKPKLASDFQRELLEIDNLDISADSRDQHPRFLCHRCILKYQRYKKGRSKNQRKLPKDKGKCFEFTSHEEYLKTTENCCVCSYTQRQSPRKRAPGSFSGEQPHPGVRCTKKSCVREIFYSPPSHSSTNSNQSHSASSSPDKPKNFMIYQEEKRLNANPFEDDKHPLPGIPLNRFTEREFA